MNTANSRQVGGSHYKSVFQHWDLVAECQLGYFEGQISRYLDRHTKKNGLQDVEKAEHFLTKVIELSRNGYPAMNCEAKTATVHRYFSSNPHIGPLEQKVIMALCFWTRTKHIEPALAIIHQIKEQYAQADKERRDREFDNPHHVHPPEDGGPDGQGYTNQDRGAQP